MIWRSTLRPLVPLCIPRTPVIVPLPVVSNRELHDRDAEARRIRVERNVTALIVISDIRRVEPSAIVFKRHIAPAPIVETAHHLNWCIGIEPRHVWIAVVRTRIDVDRTGRHRILRMGGSAQSEQTHAQRNAHTT